MFIMTGQLPASLGTQSWAVSYYFTRGSAGRTNQGPEARQSRETVSCGGTPVTVSPLAMSGTTGRWWGPTGWPDFGIFYCGGISVTKSALGDRVRGHCAGGGGVLETAAAAAGGCSRTALNARWGGPFRQRLREVFFFFKVGMPAGQCL